MSEDRFTAGQAAKHCGLHVKTLRDLDRPGKLHAAQNLAWYGRIALSILKGGEFAQMALSRLSDVELAWFMVGRANAEPPERATRGETEAAGSNAGAESLSREKEGAHLCSPF